MSLDSPQTTPEASDAALRGPEPALTGAAPSIGALLRDLGLSPRKALGQHFLVSPGVLTRILDAADIAPGDGVVEVGPGLGVLTRGLVERGARVTAVELDEEMAAALAHSFADQDRVRIICADARTVDLASLGVLRRALHGRGEPPLLRRDAHRPALPGGGPPASTVGRHGAA